MNSRKDEKRQAKCNSKAKKKGNKNIRALVRLKNQSKQKE